MFWNTWVHKGEAVPWHWEEMNENVCLSHVCIHCVCSFTYTERTNLDIMWIIVDWCNQIDVTYSSLVTKLFHTELELQIPCRYCAYFSCDIDVYARGQYDMIKSSICCLSSDEEHSACHSEGNFSTAVTKRCTSLLLAWSSQISSSEVFSIIVIVHFNYCSCGLTGFQLHRRDLF